MIVHFERAARVWFSSLARTRTSRKHLLQSSLCVQWSMMAGLLVELIRSLCTSRMLFFIINTNRHLFVLGWTILRMNTHTFKACSHVPSIFLLTFTETESELDDLDCATTEVPTTVSKKRWIKCEEGAEVVSVEQEDQDNSSGLAFILGSHAFKPLHLLSEWEHPVDKTKMVQ